MKNRFFMCIIAIISCMSLCACAETKRSSDKEEYALMLNMQISTFDATLDLADSNRYIMEALYAEDDKEAVDYIDKAVNELIEAEEKIGNVISSPNFIEEEMEKLQENYKKTTEAIQKFPDISDEEGALLEEGTIAHVYLMKCFQAFANLYCIREFDKLPDEEANKTLKETWWEFGFEDDIQCPDTIEKQELYLIWAEQHLKEEVSQTIIREIENLRQKDDLTSKECNKEWMDLVQKICSTENRDVN